MDQQFASGFVLPAPDVNAMHQLTRAAPGQGQNNEREQVPATYSALAQGNAPIGR
jgi:hypothetical protein